jgi:glycosyltransferase involved in cell wall biosynthesis
MSRKLRVAIDCRMPDSRQGVGTAVLALAKALSDSEVTDQEYTFIVHENMRSWLAPYVYGPCKLEGIPESKLSATKAALRRVAPLRFLWKQFKGTRVQLLNSDGYVESQQFDIGHFPTQSAYLTELSSIYQPWDLQHIHYPQFFSKIEFSHRENAYREFCDRASYVCVQAEWTKQDVHRHFKIPEDKIVVIPWGCVLEAYEVPSAEETKLAIDKYELRGDFFFYPAVTWPHKNHEVIFRALHLLKSEHGIMPHAVFSGSSTNHRSILNKLAQDLGILEQLHFLGFVTPKELQAIFRTATAMIFPSKFEGFGLPILEAFHCDLPVLSSNATTLPEVARDGALYFDPDSPRELAVLMKRVLDAPELRAELARKGTLVLSQYSIKDTAADLQKLYERTSALPSRNPLLPSARASI